MIKANSTRASSVIIPNTRVSASLGEIHEYEVELLRPFQAPTWMQMLSIFSERSPTALQLCENVAIHVAR